MNIEEFRNYCIGKKGVTESFPFANLPDCLVFKVAGKMFAATDVSTFASITLKCPPEMIEELRAQYESVRLPTYMSKRHWNRVLIDGSVPDRILFQWITESYELVIAGLPKSKRQQFD